MYFDFKIDQAFLIYQAQKVNFLNLREFHLMRLSKLKVREIKQFSLAENVIGGRFLNHSTVVVVLSHGSLSSRLCFTITQF